MANNCQIPTPKEYVLTMLDLFDCNDITYGKRILENSCGEGNVLCAVVERFIRSSQAAGIEDKEIKKALENDVVGYETDKDKVTECVSKLSEVAKHYGLADINWRIINSDYLESDDVKFDVIVGNPPYITYHDMTDDQRKQLSSAFNTCKEGRYDYCYAFIEKSIESLNTTGKLVYLVPYSILRNKFAGELRKKLQPVISEIYDYDGIKIFDDIISSSVIIVCNRGADASQVKYVRVLKKEKKSINRSDLQGEKWFFTEKKEGKRFGDYFDVSNSVATLKNDVFIVKDENEELEEELCFPAVSAKTLRTKEKLRIIVPYEVTEGKFERISETAFRKKYPKVYAYLLKNKNTLDKRDKSQKNEWYEFGRTQALNQIIGKKLVFSMIVTNKVNIYLCENNEVPFAGYFVTKKKESDIELETAKQILESDEFYEYVKTHGTPTTPFSYRISVKEIQEFRFD